MKIFIIAGEASGDLHGSHLMRALRQVKPEVEFQFWGGDLMLAVDNNRLKSIESLAFMGFWEVIQNLATIRRFFGECKKQITAFNPDAILFIDYPGFNLRMAKWAKNKGYKTFYYISPQLWAWKGNRIEKIKKYIDRLFVILPFEKEYYRERMVDVSYYGHPLLGVIDEFSRLNPVAENDCYSIFPGSRKQEITNILPLMLAGARLTDIGKFYISKAPHIPDLFYHRIIGGDDRFALYPGTSYELFARSQAAMVTSGTATLECALFGVPQIVCYYGSPISYQIAKRVVKIDFISLVNLILGRAAVTELIQQDCTPQRIGSEFQNLFDTSNRNQIKTDYQALRDKLSTEDGRSVPLSIAQEIVQRLKD